MILKWYKRDVIAALDGMMMLTLEERGAYNTILDLIYNHDDKLIDDDRYLCGWLRCDMRVWRRIKARLISLQKLTIADGLIHNYRATFEVDEALARVVATAQLSRSKGRKSGIARKQNKELAEPMTNTSTLTSTIVSSSSSADLFADVDAALRKIEGINNHAVALDVVTGPIFDLVKQGYDLPTQIIPSIRKQLQRARPHSIRSWRYFVPGIIDSNQKPNIPKPQSIEINWSMILPHARRSGMWDRASLGPAPFEQGCKCPDSMLTDADRIVWKAWRAG